MTPNFSPNCLLVLTGALWVRVVTVQEFNPNHPKLLSELLATCDGCGVGADCNCAGI